MLSVAALTVVVVLALGRLASEVLEAAAAQSAADAAALAGATGGEAAAAAIAAANGASLVSFTESDHDVIVSVELDGRRAWARATTEVGWVSEGAHSERAEVLYARRHGRPAR